MTMSRVVRTENVGVRNTPTADVVAGAGGNGFCVTGATVILWMVCTGLINGTGVVTMTRVALEGATGTRYPAAAETGRILPPGV
jgi:hypothetical protein